MVSNPSHDTKLLHLLHKKAISDIGKGVLLEAWKLGITTKLTEAWQVSLSADDTRLAKGGKHGGEDG